MKRLEAIVAAAKRARAALNEEPMMHGDHIHREWLSSHTHYLFLEFDTLVAALEQKQ